MDNLKDFTIIAQLSLIVNVEKKKKKWFSRRNPKLWP